MPPPSTSIRADLADFKRAISIPDDTMAGGFRMINAEENQPTELATLIAGGATSNFTSARGHEVHLKFN